MRPLIALSSLPRALNKTKGAAQEEGKRDQRPSNKPILSPLSVSEAAESPSKPLFITTYSDSGRVSMPVISTELTLTTPWTLSELSID